MSRAERELEKAIKHVVRGEPVAFRDVLERWKALGAAGSRLALQILNRPGAWEELLRRADEAPEVRELMEGLAVFPGISSAGLQLLEAQGIHPPPADAPSRRALGIFDAARREDSGDWARARDMLLADSDVMEGALSLLEGEPAARAAEFLHGLLAGNLTRDQDRRIRKALYRLKQQGYSTERGRPQAAVAEKEWWALGENREPNLQFAICFRFHSAFSSFGDLYFLRIWEGHEAFPIEQDAGIQMNRSLFLEVCQRYSAHISGQIGVEIPVQPASAEHAHFFLRKTISLLPETADPKPLMDFLKFLGAGEGEDPVPKMSAPADGPEATLLQHPYFQRWMIDPADLQDFFGEVQQMETGPIILIGAPLVEQKHQAASAALARYFDPRRRLLWAFACQKAAYFLHKQDPQASASAMRLASVFQDASMETDRLAAAQILFERSIRLHDEMEKQKQQEAKETSLIMTPDEFARSTRRK